MIKENIFSSFLRLINLVLLVFLISNIQAKNYFIAVDGDDSNTGTINSPFATLKKVQSLVVAGDTVYIREGTYKIKQDDIMTYSGIWGYVFDMQKSGTASKRICYWGYQDERPILDLSDVKPVDKRVIVFYVKGSYLHFKNFEIVGTQVTIVGHTQSECFRNDGGNYNIYENLSMHDGMAIGFYLVRGANNLVLNCDAYNNFDDVSDGGKGGNVDGFGGHPNATATGNIFRGCRAWYNSDDGFDLINAHSAYIIENCWSFYNGYRPNTFTSAGDGAGFKSGGYGMSENPSVPAVIPRHIVRFCLAYYNKNQGFYANHHLGGITWYNNTGYKNPSNFNMLNRKSAAEVVDVAGYGHIIKNNLSFEPRTTGNHIINVNTSECEISNNSFLPTPMSITSAHFESLDASQLTLPRKQDGSLPDIGFLKPKKGSQLIDGGVDVGFAYQGNAPDMGCFEYVSDLSTVVNPKNESIKIWMQGNMLNIYANQDTKVRITSITGSLYKSIDYQTGYNSIHLNRGIYVVQTEEQTEKVIVL